MERCQVSYGIPNLVIIALEESRVEAGALQRAGDYSCLTTHFPWCICFILVSHFPARGIQEELLLFLLLFEAPREILSSVSVVKLLKKHPEWLKFGQVLTFETIYVAKVQDHVTWTGRVSWKLCGGIKRWRQCPGRSMESWAAVLTSSHCKSQPGTIMQRMFCEQVVSRDGWKGARVR